jgi:hypothetical protein
LQAIRRWVFGGSYIFETGLQSDALSQFIQDISLLDYLQAQSFQTLFAFFQDFIGAGAANS